MARQSDRRRSLLRAQLESSLDGILILDDEWEVLEFNDQFVEMWGFDADTLETAGFDVRRAIAERVRNPEALRERIEAIEESPAQEDRSEVHLEDGRIFDRYSAPVGDDERYYGRVFTFRNVTSRWRYERAIESLLQASRELTAADSQAELADTLVAIAEDVLGQPITTYWSHDRSSGELGQMAATDGAEEFLAEIDIEELPTIREDTTEMEVFESGESRFVDRYRDLENPATPGAPLGTTLLVPIGDHGLMAVSAGEVDQFEQIDRQLIELLAGNAEAAFDRLDRTRELAEREQRLRTIVENVPLVLFAFDADGTFTLSEGLGLAKLGYESGEMNGDSVFELFGDVPEIVDACERVLEGEAVERTVDVAGRSFDAAYQPIRDQVGEVVGAIGVAIDVTDREHYQRAIESLHGATREMITGEDAEAVSAITARTARTVLDLPLIGVWLADEGGSKLRPAGASGEARELLGPQRSHERGEGPAWEAFESGETLIFDDVREARGAADSDTPVRSELFTPIGEYGVLTGGTTVPADVDENDVALMELLAENAAVAIERTHRQQVLERQTDQMEFFNSILRHDVLNGMTVIRSRAEFLEERLDGRDGEFASTIVDWCDDIVEIIGRVRSVLETLTEEVDPSLQPVNLDEVVQSQVQRIEGTYPEIEFSTEVPPGVRVMADELLSDVLGNLITNAVEHNEREGLDVDVSVVPGEETVTVRIADTGAGIPDDMKETIFRRDETGHAKSTGSGFGLFFVDSMVDKYGGDVRVEDNEAGGATFVVALRPPDRPVDGMPPE